jgi:hypothetical protein
MARHRPASARDAALLKLRRVNRWVIAASVALAGVLSEVAAAAFPGKTIQAGASTKSGHSPTRASQPSGSPTTSTGALTPPAQAPQAPAESAPPQEAAPPREPAPAQESAPAQEPAPAQESAPTVSGGS